VDYLDFSLKIEPKSGDDFPLLVLGSPAGSGRGSLRMPFGSADLGMLLERLGLAVRGSARETPPERTLTPASAVRPTGAPPDPLALGAELFRALFPQPVLQLFDRSLGAIEGEEQQGLRLALHLDPESPDLALLASLPWELLYRQERRESLCLARRTPLARHLDVPRPCRPLRVEGPLCILVAAASPAGEPPLDLAAEREKIEATWAKLPGVHVEILDRATATGLRAKLHERPFHVLHFMGHGGFAPGSGEGTLLCEGEAGQPAPLPGPALAHLLGDFSSLRLVFLNACDTARIGRRQGIDPFAGVATALVMAGLPAVVAMQFPISDGAALAFSRSFYQRLAAGDPVDAAVVEGRMAIHLADPDSLEWATPVLFLRGGGGAVFETAGGVGRRATAELARHLIDTSSYIAEKTAGFVGRRWIFAAVEQFTREAPRGYFLLRGDPGIGKTTFLAEMVRRDGNPHHFNLRAAGIQRADLFLSNLCAQLIVRYGLDFLALPPEATQDGRFLGALLARVAGKLSPGEKAVLVVDALDETDASTLTPGANVLYLPVHLPAGVYVVATTRRGPLTLRIDCEQRVLDLEQDSNDNLADVRELVESRLPLPGIRAYLAAQGLDETTFVDELIGKSQGNFMYLRYVLPEIERGVYRDRNFASLPSGLQSYYQDHWQRMRAADEGAWFHYQLPVLVALTVVKEPVSVDLIAAFSGVSDARRIRAVLAAWDGFLYTTRVEEEKRYRLYHASFHDFIAAKDEVAGEQVSFRDAHGRIAGVLWKELEQEL